jgi:glycosyltransferase involved in cell wall biosynthesis
MNCPRYLFAVVKHGRLLGASEDLVTAAAVEMASAGQAPVFWFNFKPPETDQRIRRLREAGCPIHFHDPAGLALRVRRRLGFADESAFLRASLRQAIREARPSMVVLNQGGNSDAGFEAAFFQEEGLPYTVLCHSATESSWPDSDFLPIMRGIFAGARSSLFVSAAIHRLTEAQIGMVIPDSAVVYNPCKFGQAIDIRWPDDQKGLSLAVVSRIENKSKGHDLILGAMARPEWRERPLSVTFYGDGPHREPLIAYAKDLGLESVHFAGHVDDIRSIWEKHHGFIQASRFEGYGLSPVEAMFCGRMAIATPFPAAVEFVQDGETGFLARAASVIELSAALEHAWAERHRWREMGKVAAEKVMERYPKDPVGNFLELIGGGA